MKGTRFPSSRWLTLIVSLACLGGLCVLLPARPAAGSTRNTTRPQRRISGPAGSGVLAGVIHASGGPFLRDRFGRVVVLHGVNAVYKRAPYELYPAPGRPYDFSAEDAARIRALGFNVVRLGIIWEGLEPGTDPSNDPAICTPGKPHNPHQFNAAIADAYLRRLKRTVDLLGDFHIYTLLDMHQDLYSSVFGGEGAPPWAVCSDDLSTAMLPGRWSRTYGSPGLKAAFAHFWDNDVVGDLQGEYDRVWAFVASYFRNDPWVIGYDPMNEPFSSSFLDRGHHVLDAQIECFYTGTVRPGRNADRDQTVACPSDDPTLGVIPTIEKRDPHHLVFYEPDIFTKRGSVNYVGPMDLPRLVFNFHAYCSQRNPVTGNPTDAAACEHRVVSTMNLRLAERSQLGSPAERGGPAVFMSEFGATSDESFLDVVADAADRLLVGWTYWAWKDYDDPTGSADEGLVDAGGALRPSASVLAQTYAEAIAGTPALESFDAASGRFALVWRPASSISAPTLVEVPALHYPAGYCASASGATVISPKDAGTVEVENAPHARRAELEITAGACPRR